MLKKSKGTISETLDKGLKILNLYCGDRSSYSLGEISRILGINKTSVSRFVNTLCEHGYLQKGDKGRAYSLGIRTIPLAHSFLQKAEIVRNIKPYVDEIHKLHDLHIDVGLIQNNNIYLVYRRESKDTLAFLHFTAAGDLYNLATGKAAMAFMEEEQLAEFQDRPDLKVPPSRTAIVPQTLHQELQEIKARGYSLNKETFLPGLIAIGAPVFNLHSGKVVGGVSFDSSTARFTMEAFEQQYAGLLVELAKKISAAISV
jgi:IclR family pca regulon transcriptional regulator